MCEVPSTAAFLENLLDALLVLIYVDYYENYVCLYNKDSQ